MASSQQPSKQSADDLTVATLTKAQRRKLQAFSHHHEFAATAGVLNMMLTTTVAVRFPAYFWIWHIARTQFYIPTRYVRFRARKWELYLIDWCYVVTYLSNICAILAFFRVTLGIWTPLVDYNSDFIHAGFAMACGPLAWSLFIFRNSIVFHDVDHSTSVFIHISPFVLFWCLRWGSGIPSLVYESFPGMFQVCASAEDFAQADACLQSFQGMLWCKACSAPPSAFLLPPAILYLFVWAVPYFLVIFVWLRDWCERTHRETLYTYYVQTQPKLNEYLSKKLQGVFGERYAGPMGYMLLHLVGNVSLSATSYILWHSFLLHTVMLVCMLVIAVHNGTTFMFRVFAYRYAQDQLEKHKDVFK